MLIAKLILLSFTASLLLTGLIKLVAEQWQVLDRPVTRSAHSQPVPVGGGLAIVLVFLVAMVWLYSEDLIPQDTFVALLGAVLIAAIGLFDDVWKLHIRWRLPLQFLAAVWVLYWLGRLPAVDLGIVQFPSSWLLDALALLALVWLLNLYNFMDGVDGLAAAELLTVTLLSFFLAITTGDGALTLLSAVLCAAAAGFLLWNWQPAKIFMGDVGSGFAGFTLGVLALHSLHAGSLTVWTWLLLLGVFVVDASLTLLRRVLNRAKWYEGHSSHAYQHAARHYKCHWKVTITLVAVNMFWLAPLAWYSIVRPELGLFLSLLGLAPLVALASHFDAGQTARAVIENTE